jgi:D-aminopeptidase
MTKKILAAIAVLLVTAVALAQNTSSNARPRASDLRLKVGILPTGPLDAITDVAGVEVGHSTIIRGDDVRTGVTAILPHSGNLFREKVPGAVFVGNAFGKLAGSTQVNELGEIESPILLTSTLSVPRVADALIDYMLALPGNEEVESINPLVGETNDGYLNDIRGRHITREDVFAAIKSAKAGPVEEGSVGGGHWDGSVRLQGRHRNFLAPHPSQVRRVHGRRPRPNELRWRAHHRGRTHRSGTGPLLPARRAST